MVFKHNSKNKRWTSLKQAKKLLTPVYGITALALIFSPAMPLVRYLQTAYAAGTGVVINEIFTKGNSDWVEIYNNGPSTVGQGNFQDYKVADSDGNEWDFPKQNFSSGEYFVIETSNRFNNGGDTVTLFDKQGNELDSVEYGGSGHDIPEADESLSRLSNGTGDFAIAKPTKNAENQPLDADKPVENIDTSETFDTIQAAINDSDTAEGHTIEVSDGTYGSFSTSFGGDDDLTIKAKAGAFPAIEVAPAFTDRIVDLRANGTTFKGFTVRSTSNGNGVGVSMSGQNLTVQNNTVEGTLAAIQTTTQYDDGNSLIANNTISDTNVGISLQNKGNTVTNNDVSGTGTSIASNSTGTVEFNNFTTTAGDNVGTSTYKASDPSFAFNVEKNWWGSQSGVASANAASGTAIDSDPWLCQPFQDGTTVSTGGSCDSTKPHVQIDTPADGDLLNTGTFTVEGTASDDDTSIDEVKYTVTRISAIGGSYVANVDNGVANGASNWNFGASGLSDGFYRLKVQAFDTAGNHKYEYHDVEVDTTAPDVPDPINPDSDTNPFYTGDAFTQQWTDESPSGAVKYEYLSCYQAVQPTGDTCPGGVTTWTNTYTGTSKHVGANQPDSHFFWHIRAVDAAGNKSAWSDWREIVIDSVKPATTWDASGPVVTSNPTLNGNATDNLSGVDSVELRVEDGSGVVQDWTSTGVTADDGSFDGTDEDFSATPATTLPDGTYTFLARATDKAGNIESTAVITVTVDTTAPDAPTITSPGARTWHKTAPITNSWTAVSDDSGIDYYQIAYNYDDGHSFGGSTCPGVTMAGYSGFIGCRDVSGTSRNHTPASWEQGGVTIWVRAVDNAGNVSPWSDSVHYYYDHESPVTDIVAPTGVVGNSFTIEGEATDNLALNRVYVQLVNREDNRRYGGTTINLIAEGANANWSRTYKADVDGLPDGDYAAHVAAVDMAGNRGAAGWTDDFTVDNTAPSKPEMLGAYKGHNTPAGGLIPCGGYTNTTKIRIAWEHNPEDDIDYYWFGTKHRNKHRKVNASKNYYNGNMTPGHNPYHYTVIAVDHAGNESPISDQCGLTLDTEDPLAEIINPSDGDMLAGTIELKGVVADDNPMNSYFRIEKPDGTFVTQSLFTDGRITHTFNWDTTSVDDGTYKVYFEVRDKADNKDGSRSSPGASVKVITVTVDNTAPDVDAGSDDTVTGQSHSLAGATSAASAFWTQTGGPGAATFDDDNSPNTNVTVSDFGTYSFELAATDDAGNSATDTVVITFEEPEPLGVQTANQQNQNNQQQSNQQIGNFVPQTAGTGNSNENEENSEDNDSDNEESGNISSNNGEENEDDGEVAGTSDSDNKEGGLNMWWLTAVPVLLGILFFALSRRSSGEAKG